MKKRKEYVDPVVEEYKKKSPIESENQNIKRIFSKYKVITHIFIIVFPPYALYRTCCGKSQFQLEEKIAYSFICIMLIGVYILAWI
ncbi:MAG: hypothetical protein LUF02_07310 [Erysipelotrichaceae bacterium]|nr:hypothetical protein [Erysipelotrichaceae bacterium]